MISGQSRLQDILLILVLLSTFILPPIRFADLPSLQLVDFIWPFLFVPLYRRSAPRDLSKYIILIALVMVWMCVSIAANGRIGVLNDWFEIIKELKYLGLVCFFATIVSGTVLNRGIEITFYFMLVVNGLHYFNVFNINQLIIDVYEGGIHIELFGLNSLGEPGAKRMVGVYRNPNINAILFSFYAIWYFPVKWKGRGSVLFLLSLLCFFLCQSRTGLIAFGAWFILGMILYRFAIKQVLTTILAAIGTYGLAYGLDSSYFASAFSTNVAELGSVRGRLETWRMLGNMIKKKPWLGHGPFKQYFYDNELYAESEYVLQTWRYGIPGLSLLLVKLIYPLIALKKWIQKDSVKKLFLFTVVILITSLTNNPLQDRNILVLSAIILGLALQDSKDG